MKRLILAALALAIAAPAAAQLYKWVDKDGKTHYSDTPPPGQESKSLNVTSGASSPAATPAPAKGVIEREKDMEKVRQASRDAEKKADDTAKKANEKQEACDRAKSSYATYRDGGRIHKYDAKGERVYLDDKEIEAERERAQREMDEACK